MERAASFRLGGVSRRLFVACKRHRSVCSSQRRPPCVKERLRLLGRGCPPASVSRFLCAKLLQCNGWVASAPPASSAHERLRLARAPGPRLARRGGVCQHPLSGRCQYAAWWPHLFDVRGLVAGSCWRDPWSQAEREASEAPSKGFTSVGVVCTRKARGSRAGARAGGGEHRGGRACTRS